MPPYRKGADGIGSGALPWRRHVIESISHPVE